MKAQDIEARLIVELYRRSFVVPRYCPAEWWECDLFELTASGMWREYEIKLSRADFEADQMKTRRRFNDQTGEDVVKNKHDRLADRDPKGPNRFSFVVPVGLIEVADCPEWAGLIYVRDRTSHSRPYSCTLEIIKKPPLLHSESSARLKEHALSVCYYRMNNLYMRSRIDFEREDQAEIIESEVL